MSVTRQRVPVTAVIPTWNRCDLLLRALGALASQSARPLEVVVVDNASPDDSADAAEDAGARVIRMPQNVGFARAVNEGIRAAQGEFVAILNNDVDLHSEWLAHLVNVLENPQVWFATGKILDARQDHLLDGAFDLLARSGMSWRAGHGRPDSALWNEPRAIAMASMTAAVFRRSLFDKIGLLDEDYGSYYEDVDFGLRCALAGCAGRYVPTALAWHEGSATWGQWSPETVRQLARNQSVLVRKHFPSPEAWPVRVGHWLWGALAWRRGCWRAWREGRAEGQSAQVTIPGPQPHLETILAAGERELLQIQHQTSLDTYWKWYTRLAGAVR